MQNRVIIIIVSLRNVVQETVGKSREMIEDMDYSEPGANTNPKTGDIFSPPRRA